MNRFIHPVYGQQGYGQQYPPYPYPYPVQAPVQPVPNKMVSPPGYQKKGDCGCGQRIGPY